MGERVSRRTLFGYALPAFALAAVGLPAYVYMPKFYSDVVGAPVAVLGLILGAVRVIDAVTDPLIGFFSDRTRTRYGRRRPYMVLGALPLAVTFYMLFVPPVLGPAGAAWWFGVSVFALFLFWTAVTVPYEALGPEIAADYHERTRLLGTRDGALLAGTLAAVAAPAAFAALAGRLWPQSGERGTFLAMALVYAPLLVATCWVCARIVDEPPATAGERDRRGAWSDTAVALRNRPFLVLLFSYTVSAFGSNLPATLILYYVEYVLRSHRAPLFLVLYIACGVVFLPLWVKLAGRWGKKAAWLGAMALNTGAFFFVFFLGAGDEWAYAVLVVLSGVGFGATLALPSSMQADVIDYHELLTGARSEGCYVGLWSIAKKLAAALGVGLALLALGRSGYVPNRPQPIGVTRTLRVMYALVPCLCNLAGFLLALKYPISQAVHKRIRGAIGERRAGRAPQDPLRPGAPIRGG